MGTPVPYGIIALLYVVPATVISPCTPCKRMAIAREGTPATHSDPARGGNAPGSPAPLA
jgi:hypothetical protein